MQRRFATDTHGFSQISAKPDFSKHEWSIFTNVQFVMSDVRTPPPFPAGSENCGKGDKPQINDHEVPLEAATGYSGR